MRVQDYKFKAKLVDGGKWVCGSLILWPDGEVYMLHNVDFEKTGMLNKDPVKAETVGIFTGKKDRNGTDIYTGDIVTNGLLTTHVQFDPNIGFLFGGLTWDMMKPEASALLEVIGNIHDPQNPLIE